MNTDQSSLNIPSFSWLANKRAIFITGTGTDVGKTFVTAAFVQQLRQDGINAGYYKAALSGAVRVDDRLVPGDAEFVCQTAGISADPESLVSYIYEPAISPHLAANLCGIQVEMARIVRDYESVCRQFDFLAVEGSGGIVCPLRMDGIQRIMLADVVKRLDLPILIVAHAGLGTINNSVLTVEYARNRGISVTGFVLNWFDESQLMHTDNLERIEELTGVPVLGVVPAGRKEIQWRID